MRPNTAIILDQLNDGSYFATGSGLIRSDGLIITNAHVAHAIKKLYIQVGDSNKQLRAKILAINDSEDLAILQTTNSTIQILTKYREKHSPSKNEPLVILCHNKHNPPFVVGRFSGKEFLPHLTHDRSNKKNFRFLDQTSIMWVPDVYLPGCSGSPVINLNGSVVGIFSAGEESENRGVFINILEVERVIREMIEGEKHHNKYNQ